MLVHSFHFLNRAGSTLVEIAEGKKKGRTFSYVRPFLIFNGVFIQVT